MTTLTANINELLAELARVHEAHQESSLAFADQVLEVLRRLGLLELVCWRLQFERMTEQ